MRWVVCGWIVHMLTLAADPGIAGRGRCCAEFGDIAGRAAGTDERRHVQSCTHSTLQLATRALRLAAELLRCAVALALWHGNARCGRPVVLSSERACGAVRQRTAS